MRSLLALGLLIAFTASADAATVHRYRTRHHGVTASGFAAAPGWTYAPRAPPFQSDYSPNLSTLGGQPPCGC